MKADDSGCNFWRGRREGRSGVAVTARTLFITVTVLAPRGRAGHVRLWPRVWGRWAPTAGNHQPPAAPCRDRCSCKRLGSQCITGRPSSASPAAKEPSWGVHGRERVYTPFFPFFLPSTKEMEGWGMLGDLEQRENTAYASLPCFPNPSRPVQRWTLVKASLPSTLPCPWCVQKRGRQDKVGHQ